MIFKSIICCHGVQTIFNGINEGQYNQNKIIKEYFSNVENAQKKYFPKRKLKMYKKINLLPLSMGDLNHLKKLILKIF